MNINEFRMTGYASRCTEPKNEKKANFISAQKGQYVNE